MRTPTRRHPERASPTRAELAPDAFMHMPLMPGASEHAFGGGKGAEGARVGAAIREDVRYTGHWDDAQVGLTYFGARYYSPALARFISPDPLTVHGLSGDPNPYAYVGGSPIGYVDPFGLDRDCGTLAAQTEEG